MRTIVKGRTSRSLTESGATQSQARRLERLLDDDRTSSSSSPTSSTGARRRPIADVTLVIDGQTLHGHATGSSYQSALDEVANKLERQAVDHKEKPGLRARPEEEKQILRRLADGTSNAGTERRIVKVKRFAIEPMFEEDAVERMEELGHQFFVYVSAETERVAILYRRRDNDYGVIEPMIAGEYTTKGARAGGQR